MQNGLEFSRFARRFYSKYSLFKDNFYKDEELRTEEDVEINGPLHFLGIFTSRFGYRIRISYGVCSRVQYLMVFLEILIETNA